MCAFCHYLANDQLNGRRFMRVRAVRFFAQRFKRFVMSFMLHTSEKHQALCGAVLPAIGHIGFVDLTSSQMMY